MHTQSHLSPDRIRRATRWRCQPLRHLTPDLLTRQLDSFDAGYLREAALTWTTIEQRDDLVRAVVSKRVKSVTRHDYVVLPLPHLQPGESATAQAHQQALHYFYANLTASDALDENEQGGFKLLVRQMMGAIGRRYAIHEILWRPETHRARADRTGGQNAVPRYITAEMRHVPLEFFENTSGRLRFLESDHATHGVPLDENAWMTTVGEGLMRATSIAWMSKHLALNDWLLFSERHGTPGIRGVTTAARGSAEWEAMVEAVSELLNGSAIVTNSTEDVRVVDFGGDNAIPFPALIERMDRLIASLWRGADLSTMSREHGYGVSLQEREACLLEEDDTALITETLNRTLDRQVIELVFGPGVRPLARVKLLGAVKECTEFDLKIDEFLLQHGARLGTAELLERYGRQSADTEEEILNTPPRPEPLANSRTLLPAASMTPFKVVPGDWILLTPLGEFPHARGWQRVDAAALAMLHQNFKSFWARLGRCFGGLPFYVGHPDAAPSTVETKAYGWILDLEPRADGLYARVHWTAEGWALIQGGHYKFYSPFWEAEPIGSRDGRPLFRPVRLISAGLTNQPNLPVPPLANTAPIAATDFDAWMETTLQSGWATPAQEMRLRQEFAAGHLANQQGLPPSVLHVEAQCHTRHLSRRRSGAVSGGDRAHRVRKAVAAKMAQGMSYDAAWAGVKTDQPRLFELMSTGTHASS